MPVGTRVSFEYVITNTGSLPLGNLTVLDDNGTPTDLADDFSPVDFSGDTNFSETLDPTETWIFQAESVVLLGQNTSFARVVGAVFDNDGETIVDAPLQVAGDASHYQGIPIVVDIDIEKETNGFDADNPTGPVLAVGAIASFTYTVANSGNVALAEISVTDDNGTRSNTDDDINPIYVSGDHDGDDVLGVDETWRFLGSTTVSAGQYSNTATASGVSVDFPTMSATSSDVSNHFGAIGGIKIERLLPSEATQSSIGPVLLSDQPVTFTYTLANLGNVPLSNVTVEDQFGSQVLLPRLSGGDANNNDRLDEDEVWILNAHATMESGLISARATVSARPTQINGDVIEGISTVSDAATERYFGAVAALVVQKSTNGIAAENSPGPLLPVRSTVTYAYQVQNIGNVALQNVVLVDDNGTIDDADDFMRIHEGASLDPGDEWIFSVDRLVTAGQHTNRATAFADAATSDGQPISAIGKVTDSDVSNHFGVIVDINVDMSVNGLTARSPTGPIVPAGTPVELTYEVASQSNIPLELLIEANNGTANDVTPELDPESDVNGNGLLDANEIWTYRAVINAAPGQGISSVAVMASRPDLDATLTVGEVGYYFGAELGGISGRVWNDDDGDGDNMNDAGLSNVSVMLLADSDRDGSADSDFPISTTMTDSQGSYQFDDVEPGEYLVKAIRQPNWAQTFPNGDFRVSFQEQVPQRNQNMFAPVSSFAVADLDGNSSMDLVSLIDLDGSVAIYLNDGDRPVISQVIDAGIRPQSVVVADFDQDGNVDLVIGDVSQQRNNVSLLANRGDGLFAEPRELFESNGPIDLQATDINADGAIDLLVLNYRTSELLVMLNNGSAGFKKHHQVLVEDQPAALAINRDSASNERIIATANFRAKSISFIPLLDDGTVLATQHIATSGSPSDVVLEDFDGDQRLDLAVHAARQ